MIYRTDDQWFEIVKEYLASNMTRDDWCKKEGIPKDTFNKALRRLKNKGYAIPQRTKKRSATNKTASSSAMEIIIRIKDPKEASRIIDILQQIVSGYFSGGSSDTIDIT